MPVLSELEACRRSHVLPFMLLRSSVPMTEQTIYLIVAVNPI